MYTPCPVWYGPKNPCSWVLDGHVLKHSWESGAQCTVAYEPFDAHEFCSILNGRNVLMLGDSIMHGSWLSWGNQILHGLNHSCLPYEKLVPCRNMSLMFVRNDRLSLVVNETVDNVGKHTECPWANLIENYNITLIVMNRGAHYENDTKTLHDINVTMSFLQSRHPDLFIVWRNTIIGHTMWKQYGGLSDKPLKEPPVLLPHLTPYNWDKFKGQNAAIRNFFEDHYPGKVLFLDAYTPTILRADNHVDQLHYCIPGVMDNWIRLLYNALRLLAPLT